MTEETLVIPGTPPRRVGARPLLLGEAPSEHGDPDTPLGGRIGRRLCDLMGWTYEDPYVTLTEHFETRNVSTYPPLDGIWDPRLASDNWQRFLRRRLGSRDMPNVVVTFGRRAGDAIGAVDRPFYEWRDGQLYDSVVLPHPSGRNRLWNDPETALRVSVALTQALTRAGGK